MIEEDLGRSLSADRAGRARERVPEEVARVAKEVVAIAALVEKVRQAIRRPPALPSSARRDDARSWDPDADVFADGQRDLFRVCAGMTEQEVAAAGGPAR